MKRRSLAAAVLLSICSSLPADAAPRFTQLDATIVRVYFSTKPIVWTGVPMELARGFAPGKPLPPSLPLEALPRDLLSKLPVHRGYVYYRVGEDIALVDSTTRIVADIIENVFG